MKLNQPLYVSELEAKSIQSQYVKHLEFQVLFKWKNSYKSFQSVDMLQNCTIILVI